MGSGSKKGKHDASVKRKSGPHGKLWLCRNAKAEHHSDTTVLAVLIVFKSARPHTAYRMNRLLAAAFLLLCISLLNSCATALGGSATVRLEPQTQGRLVFRYLDSRELSRRQTQLSLSAGPHDLVIGREDALAQSVGTTLAGDFGSQLGRALDMLTTPGNDMRLSFTAHAGAQYVVRCTHLHGQRYLWLEDMATRQPVAGMAP
jgi:hypothetical protein